MEYHVDLRLIENESSLLDLKHDYQVGAFPGKMQGINPFQLNVSK
ncbi:hypothetical protein OHJ21_26415 [Virgibacillus sp. LDC1]|nr:hypothetical protein [Paenibacillus sp. GM2FR]MCV4234711.1 hypothetical protein [Virgibacillus sp. LDC1]